MKAVIYIGGIIGEDTVLLDVIRQFKSYANPTEVEVHIDSVGGCVDTGMSIFNYLRNLNIPVTTIATKAFSIASSIFMAGDERIVETGEKRIMIHMPWAQVQGGSETLESVAKELKAIEKDFINFYSNYTSIDSESIKSLLQNETFLSGHEAFDLGLATVVQIPLKAVALYPSESKENTMTKTEKFLKALNEFFKTEEVEVEETETEFKALMVQDANGVEINFPEVEDGVEPQVGDKAEVDGKSAEGEYIAVNGDTWVFEGGELKEIKPSEESEEEAPEEAEEVEAEMDIESIIKLIEESLSAQLEEKIKAENEDLKSEIKALKKLVGSEDVEIEASVPKPNTNNNNGLPKSAQILSTLKRKYK